MLKTTFQKIFDIRDGEIKISLLMQLYIFLIISVLLIVKPTINALFLTELGADHLPYGYLLVALIAVLSSYFYNGAIRRFSLRRIATFTLIFFSISFAILSLLLFFSFKNSFILYFYYVNVSLFAVLVTSQFWILANMVYNAREAKRLFGFVGSGAIAGGIFGGYLTTLIAPIFGNRILLLIAAVLILCCIPILFSVWKLRIKKLGVFVRKQRKNGDKQLFRSSFRLITKSKHLTLLACITGIGVLVAKLVDFQFSDFAHEALPDPEALSSFFGFWFSNFNVLALLLQLFMTNRILSYFGVSSTLLILPLGLALSSLLFLTYPELWVLIIMKGLDGSFKQSINKAATELSILPIPHHIKNQAKSYIDVVVDSLATGIAGFLLIFLIRKLSLSTSYITVIVLLLLFVWVLLIYRLREAYFDSFRKTLQNSFSEQGTEQVVKKETTLKAATKILSSGNEQQILVLLDRLKEYKISALQYVIINLLDHPSNKIKAATIEVLFNYDKGIATEKIQSLLHIKDDRVVLNGMIYLVSYTRLEDAAIFHTYLDHSNDYISNAALLCLAQSTEGNNHLALRYKLRDRIATRIEAQRILATDVHTQHSIAGLMLTIAYAQRPEFYSYISDHFNHTTPFIVKNAIKAAGITQHEPYIDTLYAFLALKPYRKTAIKALKKYGSAIFQTLQHNDKREITQDDIRKYIPKIVEGFKSQEAVQVLFKLLNSKDILIRLEAAKSMNKLFLKAGELSFNQRRILKLTLNESTYYKNTLTAISLLKQLLLELNSSKNLIDDQKIEYGIALEGLLELLQFQLEQSLQCIFKLLSLKYDKTDMQVAYSGLHSSKDSRINAIEFLDNLLHIKLKNNILPLLEYYILEDDEPHVASLKSENISLFKCLTMLSKNRGKRIKLSVLNLIQYTNDPRYSKQLRILKKHRSSEVSIAATTILDQLSTRRKRVSN